MPSSLSVELGQILMRALQDFQQRLDSDLRARGVPGIRNRHRVVFMHLDRHGASRSVDLAAAAGIRPQSMMKIVHELEEIGLVQRGPDPSDSRAKLVGFTAAGRALISELSRSTATVWADYADMLGEQRLTQSIETLRDLITHHPEDDIHD